MSDPLDALNDALQAALPKPAGAIGFIKVDVPRCTTHRKDGKPCMAPRVKGTLFCVNHKWMDASYPLPVPELQPEGLTTTDRKVISAVRSSTRKSMIEEMRAFAELDPKRIFKPLFDGLEATRMVYDRSSGDNVLSEIPDWPTRFRAFELLTDRLYGKPKTSVEHTGAEGGPINLAAVVLQLSEKAAAHEAAEAKGELEAYYTSMPDEVIDVGPGEVVGPEVPGALTPIVPGPE